MLKKNLLLVCIILLVSFACTDGFKDVGTEPIKNSKLRVENGRLVFPDNDSFNSTITELIKDE